MHIGLQVFFLFLSNYRMREVEILIMYFILRFYRDWRPWLLLFTLLFFSLLSKYYINIIIAIIIVLLLRPHNYHRRIISKVQQIVSWARDAIEFARRAFFLERFIARSHMLHRSVYDTSMKKIFAHIYFLLAFSPPHPSLVFTYHVMIIIVRSKTYINAIYYCIMVDIIYK